VDNYSSAGNSLGAGISEQLYHGRIYPYPHSISCYHRSFPNHPGSENFVVKNAQMLADQKGNGRVTLQIKLKIGKFAELKKFSKIGSKQC
jgi:hypothetical protein